MIIPDGYDSRAVCRRLTGADPDAHLVACGPDKRPQRGGWQRDSYDAWQRDPLPEGEIDLSPLAPLIGVVPYSLGLTVVDVDVDAAPVETGVAAAVDALGEPLARVDSPSGGAHLLYASPGAVPNMQWKYGDLRGARGFCIVWAVEPWLRAIAERGAAQAPDLAKLPQRALPASLAPAVARCAPAAASDLRPASTPDDLRATPEGGRNHALNAGVFAAARAGRLTPELETEWRQAAADTGLQAAEIDAAVKSAVAGAAANPLPIITGADPSRLTAPVEQVVVPIDGLVAPDDGFPVMLGEAAPTVPVRFLALADCEATHEPIRWHWKWRIPRGRLTITSGAPDAGKTMIAVAIAAAVSRGLALPDDEPRAGRTVVWIGGDDEDGVPMTVARLLAAGADGQRVNVLQAPDDDGIPSIVDVCAAARKLQPDMVIVDSHVSWFEETFDGTKIRAELRAAFHRLMRDGAAVLLICHWRKAPADGGPDHMRTAGSSGGLVGAARFVLDVSKIDHDTAVVQTVKHGGAPQADDVQFRIVSEGLVGRVEWSRVDPHVAGGASGHADDAAVLAHIGDRGEPVTQNAICVGLGRDSKAQRIGVGRALDRLRAAGRIIAETRQVAKRDRTVYSPAAEGNRRQPAATGGNRPPVAQSNRLQPAPIVRTVPVADGSPDDDVGATGRPTKPVALAPVPVRPAPAENQMPAPLPAPAENPEPPPPCRPGCRDERRRRGAPRPDRVPRRRGPTGRRRASRRLHPAGGPRRPVLDPRARTRAVDRRRAVHPGRPGRTTGSRGQAAVGAREVSSRTAVARAAGRRHVETHRPATGPHWTRAAPWPGSSSWRGPLDLQTIWRR